MKIYKFSHKGSRQNNNDQILTTHNDQDNPFIFAMVIDGIGENARTESIEYLKQEIYKYFANITTYNQDNSNESQTKKSKKVYDKKINTLYNKPKMFYESDQIIYNHLENEILYFINHVIIHYNIKKTMISNEELQEKIELFFNIINESGWIQCDIDSLYTQKNIDELEFFIDFNKKEASWDKIVKLFKDLTIAAHKQGLNDVKYVINSSNLIEDTHFVYDCTITDALGVKVQNRTVIPASLEGQDFKLVWKNRILYMVKEGVNALIASGEEIEQPQLVFGAVFIKDKVMNLVSCGDISIFGTTKKRKKRTQKFNEEGSLNKIRIEYKRDNFTYKHFKNNTGGFQNYSHNVTTSLNLNDLNVNYLVEDVLSFKNYSIPKFQWIFLSTDGVINHKINKLTLHYLLNYHIKVAKNTHPFEAIDKFIYKKTHSLKYKIQAKRHFKQDILENFQTYYALNNPEKLACVENEWYFKVKISSKSRYVSLDEKVAYINNIIAKTYGDNATYTLIVNDEK